MPHRLSQSFAVIQLHLLLNIAHSTQQGLYITLPASGQMQLVDPTTGGTTNDGAPLASQGWLVPPCTPSAIDPTGKWYYTLARNASLGVRSPWNIVSAWLDGGNTRTAFPLPAYFPVDLAACDHALSADGGWHVFVAVELPLPAAPQDSTILAGNADFTFPQPPHAFEVVLNASNAELGVGHLVSPPSIAATATTLWLAGRDCVAGVALQPGVSERRLPLPYGQEFIGLHASPSGDVYGLLRNASAAFVASYVDSGSGTPVLSQTRDPLPPLFATTPGIRVALMTDKASLALLSPSGLLLTANATSGGVVRSVQLACSIGGLQGGGPCPASMAYESFVF